MSIYLHLYKETKDANKPFTCIFMMDETMVPLTKMLNYSFKGVVTIHSKGKELLKKIKNHTLFE